MPVPAATDGADRLIPHAGPVTGAGRGAPPAVPPKTKVPLFPALSVHGPPSRARVIRASTLNVGPAGHRHDVQAESDRCRPGSAWPAHKRCALWRAALIVVAVEV